MISCNSVIVSLIPGIILYHTRIFCKNNLTVPVESFSQKIISIYKGFDIVIFGHGQLWLVIMRYREQSMMRLNDLIPNDDLVISCNCVILSLIPGIILYHIRIYCKNNLTVPFESFFNYHHLQAYNIVTFSTGKLWLVIMRYREQWYTFLIWFQMTTSWYHVVVLLYH